MVKENQNTFDGGRRYTGKRHERIFLSNVLNLLGVWVAQMFAFVGTHPFVYLRF